MKKLKKEEFPKRLLEIPQPPEQLYIEGELPDENEFKFLAVVGSRKFSAYGKEACEQLIAGLAGHNIVIVSGLALGIDSIAHKSALKAGLKTIAFPGSGLHRSVLYPRVNIRLADEILKAGGALISEYEPTRPSYASNFPERNRLMAGISHAVLVIEAQERSGTLITARLTTEYNRDLIVVPGSIFSPNSVGCNKLLHAGATPVSTSEELLEALGFEMEKKEEINLDEIEATDEERKILKILAISAIPRDNLIENLGLSASEANVVLSMMEIKGFIKEIGGEIALAI